MKLEKVLVCMHQGNVYTREVYSNNTTIYMDREIASFASVDEANEYIMDNYPNGIDEDYDKDYYMDID